MRSNPPKVAVAMSGGVDSSAAAFLLKKQGYEVIGITGKMQDTPSFELVVKNAKNVCDFLNIEHFVLDLSKEFGSNVVNYFTNAYNEGITPNPCVVCNKHIKWGSLFDYAVNKLACDYYVTGHYANIVSENSLYKLKRAKDDKKDQLYYLFELSQYHLSKTLFPLGDFDKSEIKQIASEANLPSKSFKESQDICFIRPPDTTKKFLQDNLGIQKGVFIDVNTNKIYGQHDGYYNYTIGQRKGIGISAPLPLYVISIDAHNNIVYVGNQENLFKKSLVVKNLNWQQIEYKDSEFKALVKIRYNTTAKSCTIIPDGDFVKIVFDEPQSGITPGQAAVIYDSQNEFLIGGGWILN
jgi:tRNA-specific 2-thiouridylase